MNFGTNGCMYNCGDSCTGECMTEFNPKKSVVERFGKLMMKKEIKKGNLNFDQSGRAYPDNPEVNENWDCIWENDGKHYKLVGDDEHKEWEEVHTHKETINKMNSEIIYSEIEHLIIQWNNDGTKTAGSLTREIMELIKTYRPKLEVNE